MQNVSCIPMCLNSWFPDGLEMFGVLVEPLGARSLLGVWISGVLVLIVHSLASLPLPSLLSGTMRHEQEAVSNSSMATAMSSLPRTVSPQIVS